MTATTIQAETQKPSLPFWTKLAYGAGDWGAAIVAAVNGFFLSAFLLDVAGLRPGAVGIIFLVSQIWDAITDPFIGSLSDRTRTRWGSKRPWLLFGAVPFGLAFFLHWQVPDLGDGAKFGYYLIVALLLKTAFTVVNVPYAAMTPRLTSDYDERTRLNTYRFSFSILGGLTAVVLHPILVGLAGDDVILGHALSASVWGLVIVFSTLVCFAFTREQVDAQDDDQQRPGLFEGLRLAVRNRPFLHVMGIYLFAWMCLQFVQNNLLLYIRYWANAEEIFTLLVLILQVTAFVFLGVWARVSERIGKRATFIAGALFWIGALVALYFVPQGQTTPYFVLTFFAGIGVSVAYLIPWSMLPDVVEYDELTSGKRRDGLYYGLFVFLQKLGISVALALNGFALEAAGYINPEEAGELIAQPDSVLATLRIIVSLVPILILLLSLPIAYFYPITRERYAEIRKALDER